MNLPKLHLITKEMMEIVHVLQCNSIAMKLAVYQYNAYLE